METSPRKPSAGRHQRLITLLVDDIGVRAYVVAYVLFVLFLSGCYYMLTPFSHGLGSSGEQISDLSYLDSLYFSVVTVTSLGYGDIHPLGFSRFLAGIEVLFGLAVMGIILAKLTSSRLSHHVSRLYVSEINKRLDKFAISFSKSQVALKSSMRDLGQAFQRTPGTAPNQIAEDIATEFTDALLEFQLETQNFRAFLEEENLVGDFFEIVPPSSVKNAAEMLEDSLFVLGQLITSLSPEAKLAVYQRENRKVTSKIVEGIQALNEFVEAKCKAPEICKCFADLNDISSTIPEGMYTAPELDAALQPDQRVSDEGEPQQ